jgi:hypothetical protein
MMVTTGGRASLLALLVFGVRQQHVFHVACIGVHRTVAEFLGDEHRGVVVDRLRDRRHDAHLEERLDHFAALERELLRQVADGDGVADRDLADHRRGRTGEARTGTRLVELAALLRTPAGARAARAFGGAQVQLAGEARRVVVVLDGRDHRVRAAVRLGLVRQRSCRRRAAAAASGGHDGRPWAWRLSSATAASAGGRGGGLAFAFGRFFFQALALGQFGLALGVGLGEALLLGEVALARFLELAEDFRALRDRHWRPAAAWAAGEESMTAPSSGLT